MKLAISLGGSLLVPELPPSVPHFEIYASLITQLSDGGHDIVVVCGGGKLARAYQNIAKGAESSDVDQIGIEAGWMHAATLAALADMPFAHHESHYSIASRFLYDRPIVICGGEQVGHSSDYATVRLAKLVKADLIINATNVDGIYNKDPNKYKSAKLIPEITYESYLERFGQKWKPGMHAPFDFEAARLMLAGLPRIPTRVVNGQRLENILGAAEGKNIGTLLN